MSSSARAGARSVIERISEAWQWGDLDGVESALAENVVMVAPGFADRIEGRAAFLDGFRDFFDNARLIAYADSEWEVHEAGSTAVVSFAFDVVYERDGVTYDSTGRDLWVLSLLDGEWCAVWRTMLDLTESEVLEGE